MRRSITFSRSILTFAVIAAVLAFSLLMWLRFSLAQLEKDRIAAAGEVTTGAYTKDEARSLAQLEPFFVAGGNEASFISSIESSCAGLSLACSIKTLEEIPQGSATSSIKLLRIVLSSSGEFENVMKLLKSFERSSYPIEVADSTIMRGASSWDGTFDISLPVMFKE